MRLHFIFFGLGLSLFSLAFNVYNASWLVRRLALGSKGRLIVIEASLLLSALYPASRSLGQLLPVTVSDVFLWLGFFALGACPT